MNEKPSKKNRDFLLEFCASILEPPEINFTIESVAGGQSFQVITTIAQRNN